MAITALTVAKIVLTASIPIIPFGKQLHFVKRGEKALDILQTPEPPDVDNSITISGAMRMGYELDETGGFSGVVPNDNPGESNFDDSVAFEIVNRGEPGFRQLKKTLKEHGRISGKTRKIGLAVGDVSSVASSLALNVPEGVRSDPNYILYAEHEDGSFERVIYHPTDPQLTKSLDEVSQWLRETAVIESQALTLFLVLLWTLVAMTSL